MNARAASEPGTVCIATPEPSFHILNSTKSAPTSTAAMPWPSSCTSVEMRSRGYATYCPYGMR